MLVDLHGEDAHHVVVDAHPELHLPHSRRGGVGFHEGVVALAVLVDLVGHRLEAPVFAVDDLAAVFGEDLSEALDEALGLGAGQVLARDEDMLVERHAVFHFSSGAFQRRAVSPSRPVHERLRE